LPADLAQDPQTLERFRREARAASALNHPNICTIYEIGEAEAQTFIVMEMLEGLSLKQLIGGKPLKEDVFLDIGCQITDALRAAHTKGIIHRDIKPANIFITNEAQAKLLDFGLAKATSPADKSDPDGTLDSSLTAVGSTIGTIAYMSPEQALGKFLDARTDLFSFGIVLYEMATGRAPFRGDTTGMLLLSIVQETPEPLRQINPDLPVGLQQIINKCLQKDREQRYQTASELRDDLQRLRRSSGSEKVALTGVADRTPSASTKWNVGSRAADENVAGELATSSNAGSQASVKLARKRYGILAACLALLATAFLAYHFWPGSNVPSGPATITQISQWNKPMINAKLSPDGHAVAFVSLVGSVRQVFVMLASGGEPLQLTYDEGEKVLDNFSPDGKEIYFVKQLGPFEVWAVPTLGGPPRRVVPGQFALPSLDGAFIYYAKKFDSSGIFRAEKSGLNEELVYNGEKTGLFLLPMLLFPGGNELLAAGVPGNFGPKFHFYRIDLTSHQGTDLGEVSGDYNLVWAEPGKTVLFNRTVSGLTNIWKYNLQNRSLTQITFGTGLDYAPMPDPGGKGIYFVSGKSFGSVTAYHVHSKESTDIVSEDATQPIISPDGKKVMYITVPAPQRTELWVSDIDGGNKVKLVSGESLGTGTWAADNLHLSFHEARAGAGAKAYTVGSDGSGLRQVLPTVDSVWYSVFSPDQKSVYVTGTDKGSPTLTVWRANLDGSHAEKFVDNCGMVSDVDPGGQYLFSVMPYGEKTGIYEVSTATRKCIPLLPGVGTIYASSARDGKSFLYAVFSHGEVTIYRQLWRDGKTIGAPQVALRVPFAFPAYYASHAGYDFTRDLSTIVYAHPGGHADLYLLSQK
jgi:serine/threonine protein kinase